jgi:hypothetical protein
VVLFVTLPARTLTAALRSRSATSPLASSGGIRSCEILWSSDRVVDEPDAGADCSAGMRRRDIDTYNGVPTVMHPGRVI